MGAGAFAAILLAGGCAVADIASDARGANGGSPPETEIDPWSLPLGERPPLYDSCTEMPDEALLRIGFTAEDRLPEPDENAPGHLAGCIWESERQFVAIAGTWKSVHDYRYDLGFSEHTRISVGGRDALMMFRESGFAVCSLAFPTLRGVVFVIGFRKFLDPLEDDLSASAECASLVSKMSRVEEFLPDWVQW